MMYSTTLFDFSAQTAHEVSKQRRELITLMVVHYLVSQSYKVRVDLRLVAWA